MRNCEKRKLPNMTPMVDVVMCILIFYMLASTFLTPELALAAPQLPGPNCTLGKPADPVVSATIQLQRTADKTYLTAFGQTNPLDSFTGDQLLQLFQAKRNEVSDSVLLVLQPDRQVPYQDVITVYDVLVKTGFPKVAFGPAK